MQLPRHPALLVALALACGGKDETTATGGSSTGAPASTSNADAESTAAPTTGGSTTDAATTAAESSSGGSSSTGEAPKCETSSDECGVVVTDESSVCPDPPPAKDELLLELLAPGKIKVTEVGRLSACNITIGSIVSFGPNYELYVTYEIFGQPNDTCTCKFDVTSTISGLTPGHWTVIVGSYQGEIDVN